VSEQGESRTEDAQGEGFAPRGAIAFMVFMVLAYAATWLFFYFLLIGRS
jgi:hypothetical protein